MTTDLAVRGDVHTGVVVPATPTMASLVEWAGELDAATRLAESLCRTSFVPKHFQGKPLEAAAAILTGFELGLSPMAALRSIFLVSGTPSMYAKTMVAVVESHGHEVWVKEQSDDRVVVCGRRKGSTNIHETMWDRARVVKAKLTTNAKYQESPQQMMVARGQAEISRQVAPDALLGVPYSIEESEDMPPVMATATVESAPRVTAAEILGPPTTAPTTAKAETPVGMTQPQSRKLYALLKATGRSEKDVALVHISALLGRELESTKDITKAEGIRVIDALETEEREAPGEPDLTAEEPGVPWNESEQTELEP